MSIRIRTLFYTAQILLVALALLASTFAPAKAQSSTIRFETLSVENGLSQSTVRAIIQDAQGFMWFGTEDGLNKYDGYSFTHYRHDSENPASISDSIITSMFLDSQGTVWIGTASGLDRFVRGTDTFEHILTGSNPSDDGSGIPVSAIVEDRNGNLWVGTSDRGLYRMEPGGTPVNLLHDPEKKASLASNQVTALSSDQGGGVWVGTTAGLDFYDPNYDEFIHYLHDIRDLKSLSSDLISALFQDRSGILWVGTEDGGLNRFSPSTLDFTRYLPSSSNPDSISSRFIRTIYEDNNGRLWIGGRNGINLLNRDTGSFTRYQRNPSDPYSLSNDYVLSIYADRSGILWFGTFGGGLSKYVQATERFTLFQHEPSVANSLNNDIVYAILEDGSGAVWVGTLDGGVNRLDPETGDFTALVNIPDDPTSLSNNDVRALLEDHNGMIWVGTYGGGLNRYDPLTGHFSHYIHNPGKPDSLSDSRVTALREGRDGNLWVGTRGGGLNWMNTDTGEFTHFRHDPADPASLRGDFVQAIFEDSEGMLWVGTYNGISVLNPQTGTFIAHYQHNPDDPNSLSNNRVLSFYETPDGTMWIGTLLGGLNRFDRITQTFHSYLPKEGQATDAVYGILADSAGYLWFSTNRGLSRFDPHTEVFRKYDRRDGLQSTEFSPGAYYQNRQGWIYFGGVQGFVTFDPSHVQNNPVAPPVVITAFKKLDQIEKKDITQSETVTLSYQDNFISFEFAALDFAAPEKNQYAYKLEGFDQDWIEAGSRRYASYTNLRGGNYVFKVIGSNPDGVWNTTGAQMQIIVVPPLWEQWWFIGSLALILLGSAAGGYRLRIMQVQNQNRLLEEQVQERTKEAERRREVAEGLREILTILNSNRTLQESLYAIIQQVMVLMDTQAVAIFRCDESGYPVILAHNLPRHHLINGKDLPALPDWVTGPLLRGQIVSYPDLQVQPEAKEGIFSPFASFHALPLLFTDHVEGGLILLFSYKRTLSEEDRKMAASFTDHAALAIANAELRSQAEEIAVSAERSRLARDLHDAVTQTLFATSLIAEVLPRLWERNPEAGMQKIAEIRELTRGALAEMRALLMELRPTALEDVPLTDLLQQLGEAFTGRARVPVDLDLDRNIELPSPVKIGFYRIAQEALNNIQKHSRATQVCLKLSHGDGQVSLSILDNGIGFNQMKISQDHFGLGIMEERAQSAGAQLRIESQVGEGTKISVIWAGED